MRAYILKREKFFHLMSLVAIVVSVFMQDINMKFGVLVLGILGLISIAVAKRNRVMMSIYFIMLLLACVGFYFILEGKIILPTN